MTEHQQLIDEVMDCFNFHKVATVMDALEWKWSSLETPRIPEEWEIRKAARRLLTDVINSPSGVLCSGGLQAIYENSYLTLQFVIEEWTAEYD